MLSRLRDLIRLWFLFFLIVLGSAVTGAAGPADVLSEGGPGAKVAVIDGVPTFSLDGKPVARLAQAGGRIIGLYQMFRDNRNLTIAMQAAAP